jgi:hypothetical protein
MDKKSKQIRFEKKKKMNNVKAITGFNLWLVVTMNPAIKQ